MQQPKQFWRALERIPGLSAPAAEWRALLGPDWEWGKSLLRPTEERAETVLIGSEVRRVVVHSHERVVAVPVDGGTAEPIHLQDVVILELNWSRLAGMVCEALGFERVETRVQPQSGMEHIGKLRTPSGVMCPVHLCMHCGSSGTQAAVRRLLAEAIEPVVIVTPMALEDADLRHIIRLRQACELNLADAMTVTPRGETECSEHAARVLDEFGRQVEHWESRTMPEEPYRFARDGRVWILGFDGSRCYVPHRDAGGLGYIQHLLARPDQIIPVETLEQFVTGNMALDAISAGERVASKADLKRIYADLKRLGGDIDDAEDNGDDAKRGKVASREGQSHEAP